MKNRMLSLILIFTLVISGCGCVIWGIRGNGKLKTEVRDIKDFKNLEISGAYKVNVKHGDESSIKISAEENLLPYIKTQIRDNKLKIYNEKNLSPRRGILIEIYTKELKELNSSGASMIKVSDIKTDKFDVELSGAGNIELNGNCEILIARISGAGNLEAKDLKAYDVYVSVSGAGNAEVYAKNYLNASVSGIGSIKYYGNPKETKTNVSGVGSITRK
ncbi:head GIN domain-containing protein [Rosettibacter firmus]|uniref:head GIN domain-containing protein n=1 Tax=Rosettibacter firmus TaxID=3111522 RepID=UPI00336C1A29